MDEKKVKNNIICISGQPVAGKGTVVKSLGEKLLNKGFETENIHIISTGHEFRNYFNKLIDFINALNNNDTEKLSVLKETEEIKTFLENSDYRQALQKSIVEIQKSGIDISDLSIEELNNLEELDAIRVNLDTIIDSKIRDKGIEINKEERPDEVWLIDSRLAFSNIPDAFSVRLTANPEVAGQRLFNDKNRGKEDDNYTSVEEAIKAREKRRIGEQKRYLQSYNIDLEEENNYNLIIDTSYSKADDVSETILSCLDYYKKDKYFAKNWTSPKTLLPLQSEESTLFSSGFGDNLEKITESIKENGYIPSEAIEAIEVDGYKYIIEGHHRNFASAYLGKTLVPYEIIAKEDEEIVTYGRNTARQRAEGISRRNLLGHEWLIAKHDPDFTYKKMYPDLYKKIEEREQIER